MTKTFRLHPGSGTPDGKITYEQVWWLNGNRDPEFERHRTKDTDFIEREFRGGILTPNGTFTRNEDVIKQGTEHTLTALAAVRGVNPVSGEADYGMLVVVDAEGVPFLFLNCIPLKVQVAAMLKAKMLTSVEAFQLEPNCPKDEVQPYLPVQSIMAYGDMVDDLGQIEQPITPKAGPTWQDEIARIEKLIIERTTVKVFAADHTLLEEYDRLRERIYALEHPKDQPRPELPPPPDSGVWTPSPRPTLWCRLFGHTPDRYTIVVDHGIATCVCARCSVKLTRIGIPKWVVSNNVGDDIRWPRR